MKVVNKITSPKHTPKMIKLSEIIKTDCYIDCGSNEKLREVYPLIDLPENEVQIKIGLLDDDCILLLCFANDDFYKIATSQAMTETTLPIHHISQIDLTH